MKLEEIQGSYDAIFSLGCKCLAATQLQRNGLRPYSGVLDWMLSYSLPHVNRLLYNRFAGFMELPHMVLQPVNNNALFMDVFYQIILAHDLPVYPNGVHNIHHYNAFKQKLNRRIQRFLVETSTCQRVLFVRLGGTLEEARELQNVLSQLVTYDFRVLLVNDSTQHKIIENDWGLEKVCAIQIPLEQECDDLWRQILGGIQLVPE